MLQANQLSFGIDGNDYVLRRERARLGALHVVFTRPDQLHRNAGHGFGNQCGFQRKFRLKTAAIATAQQGDVDLDVFRLETTRPSDRPHHKPDRL